MCRGREVEDFYTVFVVDDETKLLGTVPLDDLILSDTGHRIRDLIEPTVASVIPEADQEQVGHMIARYNLASIPVVSDDGVLLGRITFDDVIDVIEAGEHGRPSPLLRCLGGRGITWQLVRGGPCPAPVAPPQHDDGEPRSRRGLVVPE